MTHDQQIPRVNISITGDDAKIIEELRLLMEQRLKRRLSIAQVVKKLSREALQSELNSRSA